MASRAGDPKSHAMSDLTLPARATARVKDGAASVILDVTGLGTEAADALEAETRDAVAAQGIAEVRVARTAERTRQRLIAVGSGKGGVGKSTVSANPGGGAQSSRTTRGTGRCRHPRAVAAATVRHRGRHPAGARQPDDPGGDAERRADAVDGHAGAARSGDRMARANCRQRDGANDRRALGRCRSAAARPAARHRRHPS